MQRHGSFAQADFQAMRYADQLQALAVSYIQEAFFSEEDLNLDNLTPTKFLQELEKARNGGPIAQLEFNRMLGKIIMSAVPTVMQASAQSASGSAEGGVENG